MTFINKNFMLRTETAGKLYHEHAEKMPIIDYHCHLVPRQIAENIRFRDITQLWLVDGHYGDHYKWRAMRATTTCGPSSSCSRRTCGPCPST